MARYAKGKRAVLIDDRSGFKIRYKDAREEWTGFKVDKSEFTPKHPQLEPQKYLRKGRGNVLFKPRPDADSVPTTIPLGPLHGRFSAQTTTLVGQPNINLTEETNGLLAISRIGTPGIALLIPISGVSSSTAQGTLTISGAEQAEGLEAVAQQGAVTKKLGINITGVGSTTAQGSVTLNSAEDANGIEATTSLGSVTLNLTENLVGQEATAQQGTPTLNLTELGGGIEASTSLGTLIINATVFPAGLGTTASQGTAQAEIIIPVTPTGLQATANRGTIDVNSPSWGNFTWSQGEWGN